MSRISLILSLALLTLASTSMAEKFYKWVDENGVTHYSAQAPSGQDAREVNTRANASSSQDEAIEALNTRREAAAKQREKAKEAAADAKRAAEKPDEVRQERCDQHRKNLETLQNKPIVRRENPETGEMEVMDQEQREEMMEASRKALEQCEQQ